MSDTEFEVESIVSDRCIGDFRDYRVRWKGFGPADDTYELEKDLAPNAGDILDEYRRVNNIDPNDGLDDGQLMEQIERVCDDNWTLPGQVIHQIAMFTRVLKVQNNDIRTVVFEGRMEMARNIDQTYLHAFKGHFYVHLILEKKLFLTADGGNAVISDKATLKTLHREVGKPLKPVHFGYQKWQDNCTSSAAVIALVQGKLYGAVQAQNPH